MTMDEEIKQKDTGNNQPLRPRPILLSALCLFSFVCFGLVALLFLTGLFNTGRITGVMLQYMPSGNYSKAQTFLVFSAGFLLHGLALTGIFLMWNLRKAGYYFLGIPCLIIASCQLINPLAPILSTAIYIFLILLFGLFYRRFD
jgi:hypothetical protein